MAQSPAATNHLNCRTLEAFEIRADKWKALNAPTPLRTYDRALPSQTDGVNIHLSESNTYFCVYTYECMALILRPFLTNPRQMSVQNLERNDSM